MFTDAITPFQSLWLTGLLVLWATLLFGGFAFGKADAGRIRRMPTWTRLTSSAALVVAGWSWFWITRGNAANSFALLVAIGMTFGFLGDLFMARLLPVSRYVLGGIGAFGLGHVVYIAAFLRLGNQAGLAAAGARWIAWILWLLVGLVGWYLAVYRGQRPTALHRAALPYALLLASTAGFATGLALQAPVFVSLAIGGALFLLSDLILAAQLFNGVRFYLIGDVVWLTYGPAQALIVYAVAGALRVLS
ncbi:MAG: lysoplasmalogenase [Anaerolineae bacterium]|nr:lysoplasmalogenase [Anaerolineae bacterium]